MRPLQGTIVAGSIRFGEAEVIGHPHVMLEGKARCQSPAIKLVAYGDADPAFAFVGVPNEKGRYMRTARCVVEVCCPFCKAAIGEPCISYEGNYTVSVHCDRTTDATRARREHRVAPLTTSPRGHKLGCCRPQAHLGECGPRWTVEDMQPETDSESKD